MWLRYTETMTDSRDKHKLPPGVVSGANGVRLTGQTGATKPVEEEGVAATVIASDDQQLRAWRESLRPRLGGQGPEKPTSAVDTLKGQESAYPRPPLLPLRQDSSETMMIPQLSTHARARLVEKKPLLPTRTWVLLSITVIAVVYVFLWDDSESMSGMSPSTTVTPTPTTPVSPKAIHPVPAEEPQAANRAVLKPSTSSAMVVSKAKEAVDLTKGEAADSTSTYVLEARAINSWIQGKFLEALPLYKQLNQQEPAREEFKLMVEILRRQLVETCQAGQDPC